MQVGMRWMGWAVLLGALSAGRAEASYVTFTYSANTYSGDTLSATGTLILAANGDGTYTATSGSVNFNGSVISGVGSLVPNPNGTEPTLWPGATAGGGLSYDNQVTPDLEPKISRLGILFASGDYQLKFSGSIFFKESYTIEAYNTKTMAFDVYSFDDQFTLSAVQPGSPATVPEPSSAFLCGTAGLALAIAGRARRRMG